MRITALACTVLLACAACSRPEPPPTEQPPEPQAATTTAAAAGAHTDLRDAIQRPIDRAKAVEDVVQDAAEQQRTEIEAQVGD